MSHNTKNKDHELVENHVHKRQRLSLDDLGDGGAMLQHVNEGIPFGNTEKPIRLSNYGESFNPPHVSNSSLQHMAYFPIQENQNVYGQPIMKQTPIDWPNINGYHLPHSHGSGLSINENGSNPSHIYHSPQSLTGYSQPSSIKSTTNSPCSTNGSSQNAEQRFARFVPLINGLNGLNFKELLLNVLRECSDQVPIDDFYNMLYTSKMPDQVVSLPIDGSKISKNQNPEARLEGLHLCFLTLETFRSPRISSHLAFLQSSSIPIISVAFQDICKMFLAIKIIIDSVEIVENTYSPDCSLSRTSIYKAYYIICKKLLQKYPSTIDSPQVSANLILNQSQLGKVIKLTFPKIGASRLGKRGDSTYHYRGLIWNNAIIDQEIKQLIDLSLPNIDLTFASAQNKNTERKSRSNIVSSGGFCGGNQVSLASDIEAKKRASTVQLLTKTPTHSFVHLSSTFVTADCYLREWKSIPGKLPEQSKWSKKIMQKSVEALKSHDIDVALMIQKVPTISFSAEAVNNFLEDSLSKIQLLIDISASDDLYLHLYLIISTLLFPLVFASEKEVSSQEKVKLRGSLSNYVTRLESAFVGISSFTNLMSFASIVKRMINLNNLISSHYNTSSIKSIIKIMVGDAQQDSSNEQAPVQEIIIRQALVACNAFNWEFAGKNIKNSPEFHVSIINQIASAYIKLAVAGAQNVPQIPESMSDDEWQNPTYDLSYHILKIMTQMFHEFFLAEAQILQLPTKLIDFLLFSVMREFQNLSFQNFAKRDKELSKDIFRAWWVHSGAVNEYVNIIAEISVLSVRLS